MYAPASCWADTHRLTDWPDCEASSTLQETAKTFSSEVSEKAKYDVFMSAMRLDEVNERLTQAQIMIEQINNITAEQETRLEVKLAC